MTPAFAGLRAARPRLRAPCDDDAKARRDLGYAPIVPVERGLAALAEAGR